MTTEEREESANVIRSFLNGTCGDYDWDDFISPRRKDPDFEELRMFCVSTDDLYPSTEASGWCSDVGLEKLRLLSNLLVSAAPFEVISDFIRSEHQQAEGGGGNSVALHAPP